MNKITDEDIEKLLKHIRTVEGYSLIATCETAIIRKLIQHYNQTRELCRFTDNELKIINDICEAENMLPMSLLRQALREWQFKHTDIKPLPPTTGDDCENQI